MNLQAINHRCQVILRNIKIAKKAKKVWPQWLEKKNSWLRLLGKAGCQHLIELVATIKDEKELMLNIAFFLSNAGLPNEGIYFFQQLLARDPHHRAVHLYLQTLMHVSEQSYSHQKVYDEHVKWGKMLQTHPIYTSYPNTLIPSRRLRVGYTCHFVTNSTSSTLLLPLINAHRRENVEIFFYSDQVAHEISDEVRHSVEHWRDTHDLNDDAFCQLVREDQIDILLELNGHCLENRYRSLTRRPAPIQVNYYNYSSTCGVPGIDYILVGDNVQLDKLQAYYSEKIFRKHGIHLATIVSPYFPPVSSLPSLTNGYITFGSFNQAHKVLREQIQLWCEVLKRVPNSRFYMKANALDYPATKSVYEKHFRETGIDMSRIKLEGSSDYMTLLNLYSHIDIGLDTYPFGGGTTTVEACIQGVPVISLIGERFCSQHGTINLESIGHAELIACTREEFIEKAVTLAHDGKRLQHYRNTLREDFKNSSRADLERFIVELEDAYKRMWQVYCLEQGVS